MIDKQARISRMLSRDRFQGEFAKGGIELLNLPLNEFYEPPMYWKPGPDREMHELIGDLNYVDILKYFIWLMNQKVHPEYASYPMAITLDDWFKYRQSGGAFQAGLVDGDLILLDYSPRLWSLYYRFSLKPLAMSSIDEDNTIPNRSKVPINDSNAQRCYHRLVGLGKNLWMHARNNLLLEEDWIASSVAEFRNGNSIEWESRPVVVYKDFPSFVK